MKKLGQKAGAIGALLFALIPAFFMAACSTDAAVDTAAVTAALNAEKAKYRTAANLNGIGLDEDVTDQVIATIMTGQLPSNAITRSVLNVSGGKMEFTATGSRLVIQPVVSKTSSTDDTEDAADPDTSADTAVKRELEEATKDIQVVTLQFEKDGVTSYLHVLAGFGAPAAVTDTWLVYGYDYFSEQTKKAVLDLAKLNAAGWIESDSSTESLKYKGAAEVAVLAAQSFIDDVLSGKTTAELEAVYGTDLIVKAPANKGALGTVNSGQLVSLTDLAEAVNSMYFFPSKDKGRYIKLPASGWVTKLDVAAQKNRVSLHAYEVRQGWLNVSGYLTLDMYRREEDYQNSGWPIDFNEYAGGRYVYGLFQTTNSLQDAIADIFVQENYPDIPDGYEKIPVNLNEGAGGATLWLCYRRVNETDKYAVQWVGAVTKSSSISGKTPAQALNKTLNSKEGTLEWVRLRNTKKEMSGVNSPADLNKGCWLSSYIYMVMEKKPIPGR